MNEKEKDSDTRIYALDGLRGLAALAVVAYHYTGGTLRQLLPGAQFVTLFFILSGLVLSIVSKIVQMHGWDLKLVQQPQIQHYAKAAGFAKAFVIRMENAGMYSVHPLK